MDVSQYLEIFIDETKEHLQTLSDQLMILEQEPENTDTINEIFRAAHSLKGMAGTMGYKRMQRLTHDMENVFQEIRSGNMKVKPELVDVLFRGLDALDAYLNNIVNTADEGTEDNEEIINALATAGIIGNIVKTNASISGAECGCQAEIGTACSMAAAACSQLRKLDIYKIEHAAEIAMEHHLGLTCDPIYGYVQIPCIERNAVAAIRAIDVAR